MDLIVFPGGGSPRDPRYAKVYSVIESEAKSAGYDTIDLSVAYPSHFVSLTDRTPGLRLDAAVAAARGAIEERVARGAEFDFLARSFGALVAAKIACDERPAGLRRLIVWGPPPFWVLWEMLVKDVEETTAAGLKKGVKLDAETFSSLVPFEHMLPQIKGPVVVATGTEDVVCTAEHVRYLEARWRGAERSFRVVDGAPHEVSDSTDAAIVRAYGRALFG